MPQSNEIEARQPWITTFYASLWKRWKAKRFQKFIDFLKPTPSDLILDIGGYPSNWYPYGDRIARIDILNLEKADLDPNMPRISEYSWYYYWGLKNAAKKFESLLKNFHFSSVRYLMLFK